MIANLHYHIPTRIGTDKMTEVVNAVSARHPCLLGVHAEHHPTHTLIRLRVKGRDRWKIQADGNRIASIIGRRIRLDGAPITHLAFEPEPTARQLTADQGRAYSHRTRGPGRNMWKTATP
jgi:hypothetical protein